MHGSTEPEPAPQGDESPPNPGGAEPAMADAAATGPGSSTGGTTAVWYFVGATFLFAGPVIFGFGEMGFLRILTLVLGAVIFVCGVIVWRRENVKRS